MDIFIFIPIISINDLQNLEVKSLSLSEIISSGSPWLATTILKNVYARSSAFNASLYSMKYTNLVSQSLITKILLYTALVNLSLDLGSFTIKSHAMLFHASLGKSVERISP